MLSRRPLVFLLPAIALALACSSPQRDLARARKLESKGESADALRLYRSVLLQIPPGNHSLRSQAYVYLGESLWRLDRGSEAFEAYQKAVDSDPKNLTARLRLGEVFLAAGAADRAADEAHLILETSASNMEATALLGAASAALGNNSLAEKTLKRVLELEPGRLSVALGLADIYNHADRVDEARTVLQNAAKAQPGKAAPLLAIGRLEEQEGNTDAAEQAYRRALGVEDNADTNLRLAQFLQRSSRVSESEQILRRVDSIRPAQPTALPDFQLISGNVPGALDLYLGALNGRVEGGNSVKKTRLRMVPDRRRQPELNRAALVARIVEADLQTSDPLAGQENGAVTRARLHLERYRADIDPGTVAILETEISLAEGDLPAAALRAGEAVALAPSSPASHYVLGVTRFRSGDPASARNEWQTALQSDATFIPARLALAVQALSSGDANAAEDFIVPVVRDEPANLRALNVFARVLSALGRYRSAELIARRAAAVDNRAAEPHVIQGEIAVRQQEFAQALIHYEQALLLQPHSQSAIDGLTRVYRSGKITKAMLHNMEQIADRDPRSATLMEIAGRLYAEHGWYADAKRCLARALSMDPQRSTAANALAKTFAATGQLAAAADSAAQLGGDSAALLAAVRAEQRGDTSAAIRSYEAAVRQGDRSGIAANNLAWLLAQQGTRLERALTLAKTARALAPNNPAVLDTLGVVHLRRREYTEAIEVLKSASLLAGKNGAHQQVLGEIRRHLAEAYLRAGQPEVAALVARNRDLTAVLRNRGAE